MTEQQKKTAGIAITSLVLGILGLLTVWFCGIGGLFAIPAVICGHIGYSRVRKSAGALGGEGVAMAGLITGYIGIGLLVTVIPLLAAIAVPSFVNARNKSMEVSCKNNLRLLEGATQQYALDNSNAVPTSLTQLVGPNAYIKTTPVCIKGGTYTLPAKLDDKPACSLHGKLPE
jgi:competence protein ComGC